jgi:DNA end-binding protein Ku
MVALAQHVSRGKERLVLIRPFADGLSLHTLYYADEVRAFDEIERGPKTAVKPAETSLARKLIEQLAADKFAPQQYHDHWRERLQEAVDRKVAGEEVAVPEAAPSRAKVIDLMEALKQSLARESSHAAPRPVPTAAVAAGGRRAAGGAPRARATGGKKK